jgi:hypothetical protein
MKSDIRLELIVTDGKCTIRSFWLEQRKAGIYCSFISPGLSMHRSYHADGNVHYRVEGAPRISGGDDFFNPTGYSKEVIKATPLNAFKGSFDFFNGGLRLNKEVLEKGVPYRFKKVDNLLLIDTRNIEGKQKHLNFEVSLVEENFFSALESLIIERGKLHRGAKQSGEYHLFTTFRPWVLIFLMFSNR